MALHMVTGQVRLWLPPTLQTYAVTPISDKIDCAVQHIYVLVVHDTSHFLFKKFVFILVRMEFDAKTQRRGGFSFMKSLSLFNWRVLYLESLL